MSDATYDLYGIDAPNLERARSIVERGLGVSMSRHESSWCGDYYRVGVSGAEHLVLKGNYDSVEDEWTEPKHSTAKFLLYVNETQRAGTLRELLSHVPEVVYLRTGRA
jgi:hypothetical protein